MQVLANLSPDEHTRMRKLILCGILATDMDLHGPLLKKFNDRQPLLGIPASERTDADTFMLIECLSKCGDLAHLVRVYGISMWLTSFQFSPLNSMRMHSLCASVRATERYPW